MTSEGLGEMFEGDSACIHVRWKIYAHGDGGLSGGSSVLRPGSEDAPQRERKFSLLFLQNYFCPGRLQWGCQEG